MTQLKLYCGKEYLNAHTPNERLAGVLTSKLHGYTSTVGEAELLTPR